MDQETAFLTRLREALRRRRMTQADLARALEVREATVSDWFRKGTLPNGRIMLRLPEVVGVDGGWLLTGTRADGGASDRPPPAHRAEALAALERAIALLRADPGEEDATGERRTQTRPPSRRELRALEAAREHERSRGAPARRSRGHS